MHRSRVMQKHKKWKHFDRRTQFSILIRLLINSVWQRHLWANFVNSIKWLWHQFNSIHLLSASWSLHWPTHLIDTYELIKHTQTNFMLYHLLILINLRLVFPFDIWKILKFRYNFNIWNRFCNITALLTSNNNFFSYHLSIFLRYFQIILKIFRFDF